MSLREESGRFLICDNDVLDRFLSTFKRLELVVEV
jgi:hypothetical protein